MSQAWPGISLHEVCALITDGTHHSPENLPFGEYRYVTAKNIRPWGLDLTDISYVDAKTHREIYARCPVELGDVLYIKDGVTTGLAVVNPLEEQFSMLSSVALLKPRREVLEPEYLKHWLNSPNTVSQMTAAMTGTAIKRLVLRQIRSAEIPLPSLAAQKKIGAKLDAILKRVDTCRERLNRVPQILKQFREAVLEAAVSGRLTEEWRASRDGIDWQWKNARVSDLLRDISYGTSTKCNYDKAGATPVLRIPNVANGRIDTGDLKYGSLEKTERQKLALLPGDLLVVRSNGSLDLVGRTTVVPDGFQRFAFAGYLIRLRPDLLQVNSNYLSIVLSSPRMRTQIELTARSTSGVNNLNSEEIRRIVIPLPSLPEQEEIVRRVDEFSSGVSSLDRRYLEAVYRVEKLTPSVLAKAFRGDLVPQDPNDEPAEQLLKRIQAEREVAASFRLRAKKSAAVIRTKTEGGRRRRAS